MNISIFNRLKIRNYFFTFVASLSIAVPLVSDIVNRKNQTKMPDLAKLKKRATGIFEFGAFQQLYFVIAVFCEQYIATDVKQLL